MNFNGFQKIARLSREVVITEKIDGTNAQVLIALIPKEAEKIEESILDYWYAPDGSAWGMWAGSRTRWIVPGDDNFGFAAWVKANISDLKNLGPGAHFGEWWGRGIQRKYGLTDRKFSLFNVAKWGESRPACCDVVPVIGRGTFDSFDFDETVRGLAERGSFAAPGFMDPEGIVVFHSASGNLFKKTCKGDEAPKSLVV